MADLILPNGQVYRPGQPVAPTYGQPTPTGEAPGFWESLEAGTYSALNEGLLGLPDFIANLAGQSENIKKWKERNKAASDIGGLVGGIGSMFIPGGAIAKGLGAGAKALSGIKGLSSLAKVGKGLTTAGEIIKGTKGASALARGALGAAEQAIPRAVLGMRGLEGEDFGKAALEAGAGTLAGGVLGAGMDKLSKFIKPRAGFLKGEAQELLDKATLQGAGIDTRALRTAAGGSGMKTASQRAQKGGDYVNELAQGLRERGVKGKFEFEDLIQKNKEAWKAIDTAFEKNAPQNWQNEIAENLKINPGLVESVSTLPGGETALNAIAEGLKTKTNLGHAREYLNNMIKLNLGAQSGQERVMGMVATGIKNKFDDFVAGTSGLDVSEAKAMHKLLQPFLQAESREAFKLGAPLAMGSPTFEKGIGNKALMSALGGSSGAGLSVAGDMAKGEQVDIGKALTTGALGLGAGMASKALAGGLTGLANVGINKALRAAGGALSSEAGEKIAQKLAESSLDLTPMAAKAGANIGVGMVSETPETQEPQIQEEAKAQTNAIFLNQIQPRLMQLHAQNFPDMPFEDFLRVVESNTNGFDPRVMAGFLFDDPKQVQAYLDTYDKAVKLKTLDLAKIQAKGGFLGIGGDMSPEAQKERLDLQNLFESLIVEPGKIASKDVRGQIQEDLNAILSLNLPTDQKQAMLYDLMGQYGLDVNTLRGMGAI